MLQHIRSRSVALAAVAAVTVQFLAVAPEAEAKWHDNSDQLPGIDDGGMTTVLLIGGVTLAAVGLIYLVSNSGKKESRGVEDKAEAGNKADEGEAMESHQPPVAEPLSRVRCLELPDLMPLVGIGDREVRVGFAATF